MAHGQQLVELVTREIGKYILASGAIHCAGEVQDPAAANNVGESELIHPLIDDINFDLYRAAGTFPFLKGHIRGSALLPWD